MADSKTLELEIITLDRVLYKDKVFSVSIPTSMGEITVLPHHIPLITVVEAGEVRMKVTPGTGIYAPDEVYVAVGAGFVEVKPDKVTVLVDSAERVDEIEEEKALQAKARAEEMLQKMQQDKKFATDISFADASAELARQIARLKVVRRKKKRHHP